ncbi:probable leucine-rich repeat receptor-like protein kinase At5g63930 [Phragmites australis]|uniref:probable leucine-rich repeat receptor-like protein kinase At5g63930 n=1 Tax=Phragmites australis TaxID=29695 RepID=UPI002D7657C3|nr:probable leucine-rich repeat receptor-like protein kinase At5g63930 [Phragmites australis]
MAKYLLTLLSSPSLTSQAPTSQAPFQLSLERLRRLRVLALPWNSLSGYFSSTIGNLTRLQRLVLYKNSLSGQIPPELQNLQSLTQLELQMNFLSGKIPEEIFNNTPYLSHLNLGNNSLWGPIPVGIGNLPMLQLLVLQQNQLTGTVPPNIFNKSTLQTKSTAAVAPSASQPASPPSCDPPAAATVPNAGGDVSMEDTHNLFGAMPASDQSTVGVDSFVNMINEAVGIDDMSLTMPYESLDEDLIKIPTPTKKKWARVANYSTQEDEALVMAWESVSLDAITGTDQNSNTYCKRIEELK